MKQTKKQEQTDETGTNRKNKQTKTLFLLPEVELLC